MAGSTQSGDATGGNGKGHGPGGNAYTGSSGKAHGGDVINKGTSITNQPDMDSKPLIHLSGTCEF